VIFLNTNGSRCPGCGNVPVGFNIAGADRIVRSAHVCSKCAGIYCLTADGKIRRLTAEEVAILKGDAAKREKVERMHEDIVRDQGLWG
jgi:hypothetical protein